MLPRRQRGVGRLSSPHATMRAKGWNGDDDMYRVENILLNPVFGIHEMEILLRTGNSGPAGGRKGELRKWPKFACLFFVFLGPKTWSEWGKFFVYRASVFFKEKSERA